MAGRPRVKANALTALAQTAADTAARLFEQMPAAWIEKLGKPAHMQTEDSSAWHRAVEAAMSAAAEVQALTNRLRQRAGMPAVDFLLAELTEDEHAER